MRTISHAVRFPTFTFYGLASKIISQNCMLKLDPHRIQGLFQSFHSPLPILKIPPNSYGLFG